MAEPPHAPVAHDPSEAALGPALGPALEPALRPRRFRWLPRLRWPRSPLHEAGRTTVRSWIVASALIFGPAAVIDVVTGIAKPAVITLVWALGIGLAMAVVNGILWHFVTNAIRKMPRFAPWILWPAAMLGVGAFLANDLGAFSKLGGKDHQLAVTAIVACVAGGLISGLLLAFVQPRAEGPRALGRSLDRLFGLVGVLLIVPWWLFVALALLALRLLPNAPWLGELAALKPLGVILLGVLLPVWLLVVIMVLRRGVRGLFLMVHRRPWLRGVLALVLLGGAAGATYADRRFFPGTYPGAHNALRVASLWLGMWAILATGVRLGPAPERLRRTVALVVFGALVLFPFVTLGERNTTSIHDLLEEPLSGLFFRSAREITDVDRDGFSSVLGGGDCAAFNPHISPGEAEIPGNGVDDNCRRGDPQFIDRVADQARVPPASHPSPTSVLLVTIDTLRADRLSLYGAPRDTTPALVKIAKSSVRFDCAITSGGWTSIAVSSLMRGLYARRLQWSRLAETTKYRLLRFPLQIELDKGESLRLGFALPLDDPLLPLAKWLHRRGMYTMAVVDDGYSDFLSADFSAQGFDTYVEVNPVGTNASKGDKETADMAIDALNNMPKDRPFFLWVHFFGPHEPNTNHPGLPYFGKNEVDGYDQEIRFADQQVERIVDTLDKLDRPTASIITSDHGEIIRNAHDRDHGSDLKPEILWVPLLLRAKGITPAKVTTPVSLVDILPTILGLTDTPAPSGLDGVDLRKVVANDPTSQNRFFHTDTWRMGIKFTTDVDMTAVSDGKLTLLLDRKTNDLVLRPVCDKAMKAQNLYGKVPAKELEDELFRYDEETGGVVRFDPLVRPKK